MSSVRLCLCCCEGNLPERLFPSWPNWGSCRVCPFTWACPELSCILTTGGCCTCDSRDVALGQVSVGEGASPSAHELIFPIFWSFPNALDILASLLPNCDNIRISLMFSLSVGTKWGKVANFLNAFMMHPKSGYHIDQRINWKDLWWQWRTISMRPSSLLQVLNAFIIAFTLGKTFTRSFPMAHCSTSISYVPNWHACPGVSLLGVSPLRSRPKLPKGTTSFGEVRFMRWCWTTWGKSLFHIFFLLEDFVIQKKLCEKTSCRCLSVLFSAWSSTFCMQDGPGFRHVHVTHFGKREKCSLLLSLKFETCHCAPRNPLWARWMYVHTYIYIYIVTLCLRCTRCNPLWAYFVKKQKKYIYIYTSSSWASRGRKFQKKKELYSKERICL